MVNRERTLMIIVGALALVMVGYWGSRQYVAAKKALDDKHAQKRNELAKVGLEKQMAQRNLARWQDYGGQTLSMDLSQAQTLLRDDLNKLAGQCGLTNASANINTVVTSLGRPAAGQTETVRILSASFHADGKTDTIARFMYRLHARPYILRAKTLSLSRPNKAEPGELTLHAQLEVPVLPPIKLMRSFTTANLADAEDRPRPPLASTFEDTGKTILKRKPFQPSQEIRLRAGNPNPAPGQPLPVPEATVADLRWAPDPSKDAAYVIGYKVYFAENTPNALELLTELSKSQTTARRDGLKVGPTYYWRVDTEYENWEGEVVSTKGEVWSFTVKPKPVVVVDSGSNHSPPPPPPPPPPPDAQFTLASVLSSPLGGQYVVLQDRRQPNNPNPPEQKVELGQTLYGGTLIYLDPRGAVSEIYLETDGAGSQKERAWRFHPLGKQLQEGAIPLQDRNNLYGDVYDELLKLLEKSQGITQAPGSSPETGG